MNEFDQRKEHLARAAAMLQKKKEEDAIAEQKYYDRITNGTPWLVFRIGVIFCLVLNVLITIDYFVDGPTRNLPVGTYQFDRPLYSKTNTVVWVGDDIFTPYYKDFVSVDYSSFQLTQSFIFNKAKYISFIGHTMGEPERFKAYERISIFDSFPLAQLLLLIPFLVWILKRKSSFFNFMRMACLFLIFPGAVIILIFLI